MQNHTTCGRHKTMISRTPPTHTHTHQDATHIKHTAPHIQHQKTFGLTCRRLPRGRLLTEPLQRRRRLHRPGLHRPAGRRRTLRDWPRGSSEHVCETAAQSGGVLWGCPLDGRGVYTFSASQRGRGPPQKNASAVGTAHIATPPMHVAGRVAMRRRREAKGEHGAMRRRRENMAR